MKILVLFVFLLEVEHAESTNKNSLSSFTKSTQVPAGGDINTADFIKRLEDNITSFVQMCCKDEQNCSSNSLSFGTEVNIWPIITKADITGLLKDIKRSIMYQVQLMSFETEKSCQDHNQSSSILLQLQESIMAEIDVKVKEQIEPMTQQIDEKIINIENSMTKYDQETTQTMKQIEDKGINLDKNIKDLKSNLDTNISILESDLLNAFKELTAIKAEINKPFDCGDLPEGSKSGVYEIFPDRHGFKTYCDMETDGGGWTVFQNRFDGEVDFFRNWHDYKTGFGYPEKEFWLGNDNLHKLTKTGWYKLRIDITLYDSGKQEYAVYSIFDVGHESTGYILRVDGYTGTAGDALTQGEKTSINGMKFSTKDVDNDESPQSCAVYWHRNGWWHNSCSFANLNGPYEELSRGRQTFWTTSKKDPKLRLKNIRMMTKLA